MASDTLVERMTETINLWYEDEDYDEWWIYQRDYLEARNTIEVQASRIEALEAALRSVAKTCREEIPLPYVGKMREVLLRNLAEWCEQALESSDA